MGAVRSLPPDSATARAELGDLWDWTHLAANVAELVDLWSYWLRSEYAKWIHDPDDPEVKREAARRKRDGVKPPPMPLIPPVAHRPPSVAVKYFEDYQTQAQAFGSVQPLDRVAGKRFVGSGEFDRVIDMLDQ